MPNFIVECFIFFLLTNEAEYCDNQYELIIRLMDCDQNMVVKVKIYCEHSG